MNKYDKTANGYNDLHKDEQLRKAQIISSYLNAKISDLIIDIGAGTTIVKKSFNAKYIGIDPSYPMLKQGNGKRIQGTSEYIPIKDQSADIVISLTSLHHSSDITLSLDEIKRIGKNKFAFSLLKSSKTTPKIKAQIEKVFKIETIVRDHIDIIIIAKNGN